MPIYEYDCKSCHAKFEKLVKSMSSDEKIDCPECGSKKTTRALSVLYVQNHQETFYYAASCAGGQGRCRKSCGHDDRPTTDRVSACNGRRRARSKPVWCRFARTAD